MGISFFAGEAEEGRLDEVLRDAWNGTLKPLYNYMDDLPAWQGAAAAVPAARARARAPSGTLSSFDLGRGCPFQCSFCTIINVQGRKSRFRTADDLEAIVRENYAQGIKRVLHHRRQFRPQQATGKTLFDRHDRAARTNEGMNIGFTIQVDTLCHRIPNFIDKATRGRRAPRLHRAGEHQPGQSARRQEAAEQDHRIPQDAADVARRTAPSPVPATSSASPATRSESILRDIEIIKRELPLDILEFFILTPLPGSEDHKTLWQQGRLDGPRPQQVRPATTASSHHPKMSDAEWDRGLSRRLARLLHARAHRDGAAPRTAPARAAIRPSRADS